MTENGPAGAPEHTPLAITMPVRMWQTIDGSIDNTVAVAAQNGEDSMAAQGMVIRESGWAAAHAHPRNAHGWGGWPPLDEPITVFLAIEDWQFVVSELHRWNTVAANTDSSDPAVPAVADLLAECLRDTA